MPFSLDMAVYAGPMDLLLHVVRQNRIDLSELPLSEIAEGFLAYARGNDTLDLDEAGEVLYTASLLIRMKVRFLLPRDEGEEEYGGDPQGLPDDELEEMYMGIVAAARELAESETRQRDYFPRGKAAGQPEVDETETWLQDVSVLHLAEAFRQVEQRLKQTPARQLAMFAVTIEEQAVLLLRALQRVDRVSFSSLVENLTERIEVVITFLALLDLIRLRRIALRQDELFGEIVIERGTDYKGTVIREVEDDIPVVEDNGREVADNATPAPVDESTYPTDRTA